jgi:hypothetical protein
LTFGCSFISRVDKKEVSKIFDMQRVEKILSDPADGQFWQELSDLYRENQKHEGESRGTIIITFIF